MIASVKESSLFCRKVSGAMTVGKMIHGIMTISMTINIVTLSIHCAVHHLCWVYFTLSATIKPIMLSVVTTLRKFYNLVYR
jgi:hypothetical protein